MATKQVTWGFVLTHKAITLKIAENQTHAGRPGALAWINDDANRKFWAKKAENLVSKFDLMEEAETLNRAVLECAESRLA